MILKSLLELHLACYGCQATTPVKLPLSEFRVDHSRWKLEPPDNYSIRYELVDSGSTFKVCKDGHFGSQLFCPSCIEARGLTEVENPYV